MVICLKRGADLHMLLMPLPVTVSCFSKIQMPPAHPGSPGQRAIKRACVSVLWPLFCAQVVVVALLTLFCEMFAAKYGLKLWCFGRGGILQHYREHWAIWMCHLLHGHWTRLRNRASWLPTYVLSVSTGDEFCEILLAGKFRGNLCWNSLLKISWHPWNCHNIFMHITCCCSVIWVLCHLCV